MNTTMKLKAIQHMMEQQQITGDCKAVVFEELEPVGSECQIEACYFMAGVAFIAGRVEEVGFTTPEGQVMDTGLVWNKGMYKPDAWNFWRTLKAR